MATLAADPTFIEGFLGMLQKLGNAYRTSRSFWSAMVVMIYDYVLSFEEEVEYMWRGRFVWPRLLFWLNRYWPMFNLIYDNIYQHWPLLALSTTYIADVPACTFWWRWFMYATIITRISISAILILRLHVVYKCNRKLSLGLCALFVAELSVECVILAKIFYNLQAYKFLQYAREDTKSPYLMRVLLRDSIMYFGGALSAILINFVVWVLQIETLFVAFIPIVIVANSILGCHMLLHIQKAARRHQYRARGRTQHRNRRAFVIDSIVVPEAEHGEERPDSAYEPDKEARDLFDALDAPTPIPLLPIHRRPPSDVPSDGFDSPICETPRELEEAHYFMAI
ncbi:predicted protein [Postia placenta Mad-698-R]|nr:predicted protein [Postia placenta Mad-698-R]